MSSATAINTPRKLASIFKQAEEGFDVRVKDDLCFMLRVACTCPECIDAHSGQRRPAAFPHNLPDRLAIGDMFATSDLLRIEGSPGDDDDDAAAAGRNAQHVSEFSAAQIWDLAMRGKARYTLEPPKVLWNRVKYETIKGASTFSYEAFTKDSMVRTRALCALHAVGLIFFTDVPTESRDTVRQLAERIAPVQKTMWGSVFDVESKAQAENVAYTSDHLDLHTDLSYYAPRPHIQILHCRENGADGGESMFSDGFRGYYRMTSSSRLAHTALQEMHAPAWRYQPAGFSKHELHTPVFTARGERPTSITWAPPFLGHVGPPYLDEGTSGPRSRRLAYTLGAGGVSGRSTRPRGRVPSRGATSTLTAPSTVSRACWTRGECSSRPRRMSYTEPGPRNLSSFRT